VGWQIGRKRRDVCGVPRQSAWRQRLAQDLSYIAGVRQADPLGKIKPQLATLADEAPPGDDWLQKIKFDGCRLLAHISRGYVRLISRNLLDWTHRFRKLAAIDDGYAHAPQLGKIGDTVALSDKGISSFGSLRQALSTGTSGNAVYYASISFISTAT